MLTYVVQIWTPADGDWPSEMRGTVREVATGEVRPFSGPAVLTDLLGTAYQALRTASGLQRGLTINPDGELPEA